MNKLLQIPVCVVFFLSAGQVMAQTNNEALGTGAGSSITTGDYNVMIGDTAGANLSTGSYNTFVGESAGLTTLNSSDNTFIGQSAGLSNTTGIDNTFIGKWAGFSNTATDGTFVGSEAGFSNTLGADNTFVGEQAGYLNTTGNDNTFIGEDAGYKNLDGDDNTAVGSMALRENVNGKFNTAVGSDAGFDIGGLLGDIATRNSVFGSSAGMDIGTGVANTMIGDNAGANTEHAHFNTFVGFQAGVDNNRTNNTVNANRNTALGAYAGFTNRDGQNNLWLGALANSGRWDFLQDGEVAYLKSDLTSSWNPFTNSSSISSANSNVSRTTIVGSNSSGEADDVITLGFYSRAAAPRAMAIGSTAESTHPDAVVIGYGATSKEVDTVVIGSSSTNGNTSSIQPNVDAVTALGTGENCYDSQKQGLEPDTCEAGYRFSDVFSYKVSVQGDDTSPAEIDLFADEGMQYADRWTISAADNGNFSVSSFATGADVAILTLDNTGDATLSGDMHLNSDRRLKEDIRPIDNAMGMVNQIEGKTFEWKDKSKGEGRHYGVIAQDVEVVAPELVSVDNSGMKTVNYQGLIPVLLNAIREQQIQMDAQGEQLLQLQEQIERQNRKLAELER